MGARAFFESLEARVETTNIAGVEQTFRFDIEGEGSWLVEVRDGKLKVTEDGAGEPDVTIRTSAEIFTKIREGTQSPTTAYMTGKIKVEGDLGAALKLQKLFA